MGGGNRPVRRAHAGDGRGRGADAAVRQYPAPGAGRRDGAGDIEQCGVAWFVALSTHRLGAFLERPLRELDLRVVCIDGKVFPDHCMLIASGIDAEGRKYVLRVRDGATETAAVTTGMLTDLVTRVLPTDRPLLFVIDRAMGLRRAITDVFGSRAAVQRCQVQQCRNLLGHLPERLHASVRNALRDAWDLDSADRAARVLERLARSLERDHPGAAAFIREGSTRR